MTFMCSFLFITINGKSSNFFDSLYGIDFPFILEHEIGDGSRGLVLIIIGSSEWHKDPDGARSVETV